MDSKIVVGVGNIYANEALFLAKINPKISAGRVSFRRYERLVFAIKEVLKEAISAGERPFGISKAAMEVPVLQPN